MKRRTEFAPGIGGEEQPKMLPPRQAAAYLGVSLSFLNKARSEGAPGDRTPGPEFVKLGKSVLYRRSDLDAWHDGLEARRVV